MSDSLVIIPTYNEKENVERMIRAIFSLPQPFDVLIIDDGSPDGTAAIVQNLQATFPTKLFIEQRQGKLGLGTAYIYGFKWALVRPQYHYVFEMDCDFSHDPKDLIRLKEACLSNADVAIGSRYTQGGRIKNWPLSRILISYFASVYVRMVLWLPVKDTTSGFKCYRKNVLKSIDFANISFVGYAFQIIMKYTAYRLGYRLVEVPITFIDRQEGVSKMSGSIFKEAFWGVIKTRFKKIRVASTPSSG